VLPGTEVVVLHPHQDGVAQITELLVRRSNIEALHIVSHGSPGCLYLGSSRLATDNLDSYSPLVQQWRKALSDKANILLYGCEVAAGEMGESFVQRLHELTGTNISASANKTGNTALGGDWELEKTTGEIAPSLAFSPEAMAAYPGTFITRIVGTDQIDDLKGQDDAYHYNSDYICGLGGNDILNGGYGADIMIGGPGNDMLWVDNAGDIAGEGPGQGTDFVISVVSYTLPVGSEVEYLMLSGLAINGTGNAFNNSILGNNLKNTLNGDAGNDILDGRAGQDTLTGGTGADTFVFEFGQSTVAASDRITDFAIGSDRIGLLFQQGAASIAPTSFSRAADNAATTLDALVTQVFADANGALAGSQALGRDSAALVVATGSAIAGTYLVVNDAIAGFQSGNDLVVNITGYTGTLPNQGTITPDSFFI